MFDNIRDTDKEEYAYIIEWRLFKSTKEIPCP